MHAGTFDTQGVQTDSALLALLDAAAASGVRVAVHLEPYAGRDARSVRDDIAYLHATYGRARRGGGGSLTGAHLRVSCRVARAAGVCSYGQHDGLHRDASGRMFLCVYARELPPRYVTHSRCLTRARARCGGSYVYDSYHIAPAEWARVLMPAGDLSIRGTPDDAAVMVRTHGRAILDTDINTRVARAGAVAGARWRRSG
jgi:hypothetical protein